MTELRDLYQELILDHSRNPHHFRRPERANREAEGYNPLCGDQYTVALELDGERVRDAGFEGLGCAISKASASLMTSAVIGKSRAEVEKLFNEFHGLLTSDAPADERALGKLAAFAGVREFPVRVKCATLPWHTLLAALAGRKEAVSTE
jgi:nitrogen fixation NifU-like protein